MRRVSAVTFCSWHPAIALVRRGPVRGPRHSCKRCNYRCRRADVVVSVQLAHPERRAVLLISRRSWVRAPPAPPGGLHVSVGTIFTFASDIVAAWRLGQCVVLRAGAGAGAGLSAGVLVWGCGGV